MPLPEPIRLADAADVDAIVILLQSAYRGDSSQAGWTTEAHLLEGQRADAGQVLEVLKATDSVMLLRPAPAGLAVEACCQLERRGEHLTYFGMFAVAPTSQGTGIGGKLMAAAEDYARETYEATELEMTVIAQRVDLIEFYRRRGFELTGETKPFPYGDERYGRPLRDDLHFVVLRKPL